jgi:hypothetical protein
MQQKNLSRIFGTQIFLEAHPVVFHRLGPIRQVILGRSLQPQRVDQRDHVAITPVGPALRDHIGMDTADP